MCWWIKGCQMRDLCWRATWRRDSCTTTCTSRGLTSGRGGVYSALIPHKYKCMNVLPCASCSFSLAFSLVYILFVACAPSLTLHMSPKKILRYTTSFCDEKYWNMPYNRWDLSMFLFPPQTAKMNQVKISCTCSFRVPTEVICGQRTRLCKILSVGFWSWWKRRRVRGGCTSRHTALKLLQNNQRQTLVYIQQFFLLVKRKSHLVFWAKPWRTAKTPKTL